MARSLDIDECAHFLNVDKSTAMELAAAGKIIGAKIGRAWVFLEEDVVDFLRQEARRQARERQTSAAVSVELEASVERNVPMMLSTKKRGRERKPHPDLSKYD